MFVNRLTSYQGVRRGLVNCLAYSSQCIAALPDRSMSSVLGCLNRCLSRALSRALSRTLSRTALSAALLSRLQGGPSRSCPVVCVLRPGQPFRGGIGVLVSGPRCPTVHIAVFSWNMYRLRTWSVPTTADRKVIHVLRRRLRVVDSGCRSGAQCGDACFASSCSEGWQRQEKLTPCVHFCSALPTPPAPVFRRPPGSGVLAMASVSFSASSFNAVVTVVRIIGLHPKLGEPNAACSLYVALIFHVVPSCTVPMCVHLVARHTLMQCSWRHRGSWARTVSHEV